MPCRLVPSHSIFLVPALPLSTVSPSPLNSLPFQYSSTLWLPLLVYY